MIFQPISCATVSLSKQNLLSFYIELNVNVSIFYTIPIHKNKNWKEVKSISRYKWISSLFVWSSCVSCCVRWRKNLLFYCSVKRKRKLSYLLHSYFTICGDGALRETNQSESKATALTYIVGVVNRQTKVLCNVYCVLTTTSSRNSWGPDLSSPPRIRICSRQFCMCALGTSPQLLALAPSAL